MHTYKQQAGLLVALVTIYALVAFVYMLLPTNAAVLAALPGVTAPGLAAANAGTVLATYLPLGLLGLWLARRLGLPGIIHPDPEIRPALWRPLLLGIGLGAMMVIVDLVTKDLGISPGSSHPPFPASILASISAGIGEEIVFRLFVMSLWAIVLNWLLGRLFRGRDTAARPSGARISWPPWPLPPPTSAHSRPFTAAPALRPCRRPWWH
jgi:membrane protease YdiL (CAAX protease family)